MTDSITNGEHDGVQVIIFAKAPVLGTVKTRLAATIGDVAALAVYQRMLRRCVGRLGRGAWRTILSVTPDDARHDSAHWPVGPDVVQQGGGDLGARMLRALMQAKAGAPVLVVGSDIPELGAGHIAQALDALAQNDLVFGPSTDGGFYLVGAKCPPPSDIFASVTWSSSTTLAQVIGNCAVLPALIDMLDDFDDMTVFARHRDHPDWATLLAD
ncbi:TIGR04282 family arsenosugar biosynthesis glycosyltransferase [Yoonia sp.]|uniref:TIGR04282 family arsenosugar biosynthesis glycosyltransferase n=1 Tax=Yoonia sp. TaxID=2212373 RepID=UPI003A4D31B6